MKKVSSFLVCSVVLVALSALGPVRSAEAYPTFFKAFQNKYMGDEKTEAQKSLAKEVKQIKKCNVCHDPRPDDSGKASKTNRNPYGQALNNHLTEEDKKDVEKAIEMLGKIEGEKADKDAEKTFGELLKAGKVPFQYEGLESDTDEEDDDSN